MDPYSRTFWIRVRIRITNLDQGIYIKKTLKNNIKCEENILDYIFYNKDYSEITEEYLMKKYNEMLDTQYDFSKLFLSFYNNDTQQYIKKCGNFWMKRCTNSFWYN